MTSGFVSGEPVEELPPRPGHIPGAPDKYPGEILRCIVGSTLFGMSTDASDVDLTGVCIESPEQVIGLQGFEQHIHPSNKAQGEKTAPGEVDCTVYSLRKFMRLALSQNPTVLTLFFVPPEFRTYDGLLADNFRSMLDKVLTRKASSTFLGYMQDQRERMLGLRGGAHTNRPELVGLHGYDTKYAGHYIRLGFQGIELLETGKLTLPMLAEQRNVVMEIRAGKWAQADVISYGQDVESRLFGLKASTELRNHADHAAVDAFLIEMYQTQWSKGY